jgi:hypothetical protein
MLGSDEVRKSGGQIQFSPAALGVRSVNLSGSQILLGCVSALGSMGVFVWALAKLWLFGH